MHPCIVQNCFCNDNFKVNIDRTLKQCIWLQNPVKLKKKQVLNLLSSELSPLYCHKLQWSILFHLTPSEYNLELRNIAKKTPIGLRNELDRLKHGVKRGLWCVERMSIYMH